MKPAKFLLFLFTLFLLLPQLTHAESSVLGDFSAPLNTDKIPVDLSYSISGKNYTFSRSDVMSLIKESSVLTVDLRYSSEIENPDFCIYKKSLLCRIELPYSYRAHVKKNYMRKIDENKLKDFVAALSEKSSTAPVNAKLKMEDGKVSVFALSTPGVQLDKEKSKKILADYISRGDFSAPLTLPFKTINPEISTDSIKNLGITELIGEGTSNFAGSPHNRIENIKLGAAAFNGVLIKPGEEFSFLKTLGPVDAEHGYLPELSIVGNATIPEYGGGMCQVSTTAFRAAIYSGLEITARTPHAYPVSYYNPQGMDATVYIPSPDLKFVNNTPDYILIQTKIEGTKLIFNFYGTSDGRSTKVIGPKILVRNPDGSLKATFTQEVYDKDGQLIRSDVFNSNYKSPSLYPHPGQETVFTEKPADWSVRQWKAYKDAHNL